MFIVSQHGQMLSLIEPGRISACKLGSKDCKIYNDAVGEMFDRFQKYETECHDLVKSGKLSMHFPDHRSNSVKIQNVLDAPPRVIAPVRYQGTPSARPEHPRFLGRPWLVTTDLARQRLDRGWH